ncbi:hypothetical protein [Nocardia crassostreae]|uniref:hypothetical protein n=1 Tax=Nocardia crassostreae TaxID=53428 RepID=UPI000836115A|nr:hypothetical protein [Nocardia crassostreae]
MVRSALTLAELHRDRREKPSHVSEIDCHRAELIARIDNCVLLEFGPAPEPCACSPGGFVDRMAAAQVRANRLLHSTADLSDESVDAAWHHLATLADGWTEFVAAITHGDRPVRRDANRSCATRWPNRSW